VSTLHKKELLSGLKTKNWNVKLFTFKSIDSTNNCLKLLAETENPQGTIVIADHQSAGKGRQGRKWESHSGKNLLFSLLLRVHLTIERSGLLTFYAAVAIARAVEQMLNLKIECKWPNDLFLNRKKFSGILLENSFKQNLLNYSVIGCGINVNQNEFVGSFIHSPTSLSFETGKEINRILLFKEIIKQFDYLYNDIAENDFKFVMEEWKSRFKMKGANVIASTADSSLKGTIKDISDDGGLRLVTENGEQLLYKADIKLL
jgi:BirA family biotin operon repressor/biotin-[acetyl-CoA-carboxylase] ligase